MTPKKGLGKGLETMIPNKNEKATQDDVSRETLVKLTKIEPNKDQPRKNFNDDALQELAETIKQHGIIEPLIVRKKGTGYEIIAGERRWRAARIAGLKEVPVIVKDYSQEKIFEIALIENLQREDLNPIEEAIAYKKLIDEINLKQDDVANRVGKSRTAVTNSMRLLKLDEKVQNMLIDDMISGGHARALLAIEDGDLQYQTAMKVFDEKLSVRETEKLVKKMMEEPKKEKPQDNSRQEEVIYHDLEESLKQIIGNKVMIQRKAKNKGKIEIEYYSADDLDRIIGLLRSIQQ